jgi:CHAT domain-containing protein
VVLKQADGRTGEALAYMDRARAALQPAGGRESARRTRAIQMPPGELAIEYARIADTVLIWTVRGSSVRLTRSVVDSTVLARTVEQVQNELERQAPAEGVRPALTRLYDWLLAPIRPLLRVQGERVMIVADGEIAAVPFAALYDARTRRYLVEDHPIRFAPSLGAASAPTAHAAGRLWLVANPAFDARTYPLLDRLPHAEEEVRSIAAEYPGATVVAGAGATSDAVREALLRAGAVHFAGHAVFDDRRPERSYLLTARGSTPASDGTITAAELARLDLSHLRLVVLSACRTVRGGQTRGSGFTGLAGAFLAAGAHGVIGTTWNVDDASAARLIPRFYRAYRSNHDAPAALRTAQVSLLDSRDAQLSSPAAWAGFRLIGR